MSRRDKILYVTGMAVTLGVAALCALWLWFPLPPEVKRALSVCHFHELTGLYCPGCGGTRAALALLRGEILNSLRYHPIVLYGCFTALPYLVKNTLYLLTRGRVKPMAFRMWMAYGAAAIIAGNVILKNLLYLATGIDILG